MLDQLCEDDLEPLSVVDSFREKKKRGRRAQFNIRFYRLP